MKNLKYYLSGFVLILFVLFHSSDFAQNKFTDSSVTFVTYWKKGETKTLHISQSKERSMEGQGGSNSGFVYDADVLVLDSTKNSFTIQWKFKNIKKFGDEDPTIEANRRMLDNLKILYKTNDLGMFSELQNWQEIQKKLFSALDKMQKENQESQLVGRIVSSLKKVLGTKENIQNILISEVQLYHLPYGAEYKFKNRVKLDATMPNIFGGRPLPAITTVELTELRPVENYCKLEQTMQIDSLRASAILQEYFDKLATSQSSGSNSQQPAFDMKTSTTHWMEISTGWFKKIRYSRIVTSGNMKMTEKVEINMINR